jgi:hypothetical protein
LNGVIAWWLAYANVRLLKVKAQSELRNVYSATGAAGVWDGGHVVCRKFRRDWLGRTHVHIEYIEYPLPSWEERDVSVEIPSWAGIDETPCFDGPLDYSRLPRRTIVGVGFPCRTIWCNETVEGDRKLLPTSWLQNRGQFVSDEDLRNYWTMPTTPIWSGLAINTLFYAALIWGVWLAAVRLQRFNRERQGQCEMCAYDLSGALHERCPECGTTVRLRSPSHRVQSTPSEQLVDATSPTSGATDH